MTNSLTWSLVSWNELDKLDLYYALQLRAEVFVLEQTCPYQDVDGKDQKSHHLFAKDATGRMVAYARLVAPGVSYDEMSIGRVVTHSSVRRTGVGVTLMEKAIEGLHLIHGEKLIRISAQEYLQKFYENLGFTKVSEAYLEDDIPHIEMTLSKTN
jgi:ElaA protein